MKALEKDRTRRYETANGFAVDIQRYLNSEVVAARPPSTIYKFQKLVRRNKTIFAAVGAGMAALVIGLVLSLFAFIQAKAALKRAVAAEQVEKQLRQEAEQAAAWSRQITPAGLLLMRGEYDQSERILRGIPPHKTLVAFYNVFGGRHARRGEWQEALRNWNLVVQYAPDDHMGYMYLASLLLQLDDVAGYKNLRAQILRQFGGTSDPRTAERMVNASLILPPAADEMAIIAKMADVAVHAETNSSTWGFNLFAKGFTEYREGHYAAAAETLKKVLPLDIGSQFRTEVYVVLAMAQFRLDQPAESRASLAEAVEALNHRLPKAGNLDEGWNHWIDIHILMREARNQSGPAP
jgi:hypothetical protein